MAIAVYEPEIGREPTFTASRSRLISTFRDRAVLEPSEDVENWLQYASLLHDLAHSYTFYTVWYPAGEKETGTQTFPISAEGEIRSSVFNLYRNPNLYLLWSLRRYLFKTEDELEQETMFVVSSNFSQINKVRSIYFQRYRGELQFQLLLSITQYDYDLMDNLLDIEYEIRKMYPDLVFQFFYPPAGISDKEDFIHPQALCIYAR